MPAVAEPESSIGTVSGLLKLPSRCNMMSAETHQIFKNIVIDGIYAGKGMAGFGDILNEKDTEMIRQYVISRALIDKAEAEAVSAGGG